MYLHTFRALKKYKNCPKRISCLWTFLIANIRVVLSVHKETTDKNQKMCQNRKQTKYNSVQKLRDAC